MCYIVTDLLVFLSVEKLMSAQTLMSYIVCTAYSGLPKKLATLGRMFGSLKSDFSISSGEYKGCIPSHYEAFSLEHF